MLRSALTCANGCSCWSPDEENSPRFFLTMEALYLRLQLLCRLGDATGNRKGQS
jgi:hypothetical protein